jgi:two-component system, NarL family, response regulator LiaR
MAREDPEELSDVQEPIGVALSNDYELALLGLAQMLALHPNQVRIVDLSTSPRLRHGADVILYDTFGRLPDKDPKLRKIVQENAAKVVVYSWEDYPEEAAQRRGAAGYLHKGLSADELVAGIVDIHNGESPAGSPTTRSPAGPT